MEKLPWRKRQQPEPFLAPLTSEGRPRKRTQIFIDDLPPAAAPLAVTVFGAVALFFLFGALSDGSDVAGEAAAPEASVEAPPARMTSPAVTCFFCLPNFRYFTPVIRVPWVTSSVTNALVSTLRFLRYMTGCR